MNKRIRAIFFIIVPLWLFCCSTKAQVVFQFNPALHGQTLNGLLMAQAMNNGASSYAGNLKIIVRDERNKIVVILQSISFNIKPGNNPLSAVLLQRDVQFGNSYASVALRQTGRFPEGEFEYCYEYDASNKVNRGNDGLLFENCFTHYQQPYTALNLIYPDDGDSICTQRPAFSWQPLIPANNGTRYRILITEKNTNQQAQEAIVNNIPVINQDNNAAFNLLYPPQAPSLSMGKNYVWQVTAYQNAVAITKSELWEFTVGCQKPKIDTLRDSYRELKPELNGNFYQSSNGVLKFAIHNSYIPQKMQYEIIDLEKPELNIKRLPEIQLQTGLNKVDIVLAYIKGLISGKMYQLNIYNVGNQKLYLRFVNETNENE